jgi:hypothetical protein
MLETLKVALNGLDDNLFLKLSILNCLIVSLVQFLVRQSMLIVTEVIVYPKLSVSEAEVHRAEEPSLWQLTGEESIGG